MKKSIFLLLTLGYVSMALIYGQKTITGVVVSADDSRALPGVTVLAKGTSAGVITDANGNYSIQVPAGVNTLVFSFVGMETREVDITNQTEINISMSPVAMDLDEVVVVGYGPRSKRDLTGSISSISGEDMQQVPTTTFESALQGKTSGVLMTSTTGKLGEAFNIRVRGTNSITASNQPLYVVDGIIIANQDFGINTNQPMNPLITLDPNDIKSIQVLKDASASAIYGSRGANGVVIITTKSGRAGQKSRIDVGYSYSTRQPTNQIEMLNAAEYLELLGEAIENVDYWGDEYYGPGDGEQAIRDYFFWPRDTADTDWQALAFKDQAISHETYLNISGGNENSAYYAGLSYSDQEGLLIKNNLKRASGRINLDHKVNRFFDVSAKVNYAQTTLDRVADDNAFATPMQLIAQAPITPAYLEDGEPNPDAIYFNSLLAERYNKSQVITSRTMGSFQANLNIIPEVLKLTSLVGVDNFHQREEERQSPKTDDGQPAGNGTWRSVANNSLQFDNYLTLNKDFGKVHSLNVIAGMSFQQEDFSIGSIQAKTYPSDAFEDMAGASENSFFTSQKTQTTFLSYFATANYKLANRYLISGSYRMDGSSRFGEDSRFGNFYSFSGGWVVSEEDFMERLPWIFFLKPKASYGMTGNASIADYSYMNLVDAWHYTTETGFYASQIGRSDLRWEKTAQLDVGMDFGFLKNRISGEFDYYLKKTSDMLLNRAIPMSNGYISILENVGEMENEGFEFVLNATPVFGNFIWNVSFNITFNENVVTQLIEPITVDQSRVEEGQPIGFFYMPEYAGVDPDNGDALYYTETGETTNDYAEAEFRNVGSPHPDYYGGFINSFSYKGVALNVFFQFVQGNEIYRFQGIYTSNNAGGLDNQTIDQMERWQEPGDITDVPQARLGEDNGGRMSSRWIEDGSYIRLKDVSLSYTLPAKISRQFYVERIKVYVSGLNLWTITDFEGWDPEVTKTGTRQSQTQLNISQGVEYYATPQARGFTFGINVTL
ncbi:MAG: TonB-dependent receptor [Bacteroidales bacterium]|nr:TonB-dependent receptor [Bacteroidales bacterium]